MNRTIFTAFLFFFSTSLLAQTLQDYARTMLEKYQRGDYEGSIEDCNKALRLDPKSAKIFLGRAMAKAKKNDHQGAIADFSKALLFGQPSAYLFKLRGSSREQVHDYLTAIEDYSRAIDLNPTDALYYDCRGLARINAGDYEGAVLDFDVSIELNPKEYKSYLHRGTAKLKYHDFVGAVVDFNKVLEFNPRSHEAYAQRAEAKAGKNDHRGAVLDYTKAIQIAQKEGYLSHRAWNRIYLEDISGAIADCNQALQLNTHHAHAFGIRAYALYSNNNPKQALPDINRAIQLAPETYHFYYTKGLIEEALGNSKAALSDFSRCIELNKDFLKAYHAKEYVYQKLAKHLPANSNPMPQTEKTENKSVFVDKKEEVKGNSSHKTPVELVSNHGKNSSDPFVQPMIKYQKGMASHYNDNLQGRFTSSGEKYDKDQITGAHPSLPFGTRVEVTNLANQKKVIVRINDRGPAAKSRIIDLSRAAAEQLDLIKHGTAEVEIRVLD
jgi:rare lipoprotein A (peptidoglycan hydrolase)/Flp pilus assembly protein TadD